jgi:hypothetical protein
MLALLSWRRGDSAARQRSKVEAAERLDALSVNPFKNGRTYTWRDGAAAKLINGRWTAIKERHPACARARR